MSWLDSDSPPALLCNTVCRCLDKAMPMCSKTWYSRPERLCELCKRLRKSRAKEASKMDASEEEAIVVFVVFVVDEFVI